MPRVDFEELVSEHLRGSHVEHSSFDFPYFQ